MFVAPGSRGAVARASAAWQAFRAAAATAAPADGARHIATSTAPAQKAQHAQSAAQQAQSSAQPAPNDEPADGLFTSLHEAARSPSSVRRLDLAASPQLLCTNLLCDKVGEPCICRISRIFEQLGAVDELVLRGNALTELPPSTWRLASLRALDLSDNRLTALPPDVAGLENLQVLKLTGNSPELALPFAALATMPSLRELHVDRDVRRRMTRDLAAAPLLHWLHF